MSHSVVVNEVLLPSFFESKLKHGVDSSTPEILQDCFRTAGLSFDGAEALQFHFHIFCQCFAPFANVCLDAESWLVGEGSTRMSIRDYFLSITDTELNWFSFYLELLPYIRISEAVQVVSSLADFVSSQAKQEGDLSVMELCLLASALELFVIIWTDLMAGPGDGLECHSDTDCDGNWQTVNKLADKLSHSVSLVFCPLVECLKLEETEPNLRGQPWAFHYVLDLLTISLVLLHPVDCVMDIVNLVDKTKRVNAWIDLCEKSASEVKMEEIKVNISVTNKVGERSKTVGTGAHFVNSEFEDTNTESEKDSYHGDDMGIGIVKDKTSSVEVKGIGTVYENMLESLREKVELKVFVEFARFVVTCGRDPPDFFIGDTGNVSFHPNSIRIGHYVLERQLVSSHARRRLLALRAAPEREEERQSHLLDELATVLSQLDCTSSAANGDDDKISTSCQGSESVESLDFLKKVVKNRERSWQERLSQGLKKADMSSWWNVGFYDLVWENLDWLSNEANTAQIVAILQQFSWQDSVQEDDMKRMTLLFSAMYKKLPLLLQEDMVVSMFSTRESVHRKECDTHSHTAALHLADSLSETSTGKGVVPVVKDILHKLKSEAEILMELTPLLNKLTINSVCEIAPYVLTLSLYDSDVVLRQMLQVAVSSKGQIRPVVELLRQIPKICTYPYAGTSQSRLSHCLLEVIGTTVLDEKQTENVICVITQLVVNYTQVIDVRRKLRRQVPGVFYVHEVLEFFISPALDQQLAGGVDGSDGILSTSVSLSCLTSVVEAVEMERFDSLKFLTLIHVVSEIFIQHYTIGRQPEESEQGLAIKQNAFLCMETLIRKACHSRHVFSEVAVKSFHPLVCESGFLAVALCYPFFQASLSFQLLPFFQALADWEREQDSSMTFQMVIRLMQLGVVNDLTCRDVCDLFLTLGITVSRSQLTAIIAHILSQSLPCQMGHLPKMTLTLIEGMELENISTGVRGERVHKDSRLYLECVEILTDALLLLYNRKESDLRVRLFVSNYQASVQGLLSNMQQRGMPDVHYFLLYQCCMMLICLSGDTSQGLQVLAISMLNQWSQWLLQWKAVGKQGMANAKPAKPKTAKADMDRKSWDGICPSGDRQENVVRFKILAGNEQSWNLDDIQTLMDVAVCVQDEDVRQQLLTQLENVADVF